MKNPEKYLFTGEKIEVSENSEKEPNFESMKTPDIVVEEEHGAQLFSLILKAQNPEWGETEHPLAKETDEYFKENPLSSDIKESLQKLQENGVDEETLYNAALVYEHPERIEKILKMAEKYKPHVKNPREALQTILDVLKSFDQSFSSSLLEDKFREWTEQDKDNRLENLKETRKRIEMLIDFFKPDSATTLVRKVNFVPTDPLYKKNSGRSFSLGDEQVIISHIENIDNQDHEFLHGIVNPIVEKLSRRLTDEQREKISQLASNKLKQDYGEGHFSLLCEEFVRTFNDVVKKGEKPQTFEDFEQKTAELSEAEFQQYLLESERLRVRCEGLGITTLGDFKDRPREYFEKFEKNQLRDIIFELYQEYLIRSDKTENFEQFVLKKFMGKI